jgi:beta-1,4-mannosyl-glycoprotein beta-1,4-N-acetylglucosaminyltransferase
MTQLLRQYLPQSGPKPLVIFSDTDELASAHTIKLLKACEFPTPLHLRMRTFLYSFEWPYGDTSWRAQVHDWSKGVTNYVHSMQSKLALADSGWHCSYAATT